MRVKAIFFCIPVMFLIACDSGKTGKIVITSGPPIEFDFQGLKIGDEITQELMAKCHSTKTELDPEFSGRHDVEISGQYMTAIYKFIGGKCASIKIEFDGYSFKPLQEAYTEKFGPPHKNELSMAPGTETVERTLEWNTTDGYVFTLYWESGRGGSGVIETDAYVRYVEGLLRKSQEELRDGL